MKMNISKLIYGTIIVLMMMAAVLQGVMWSYDNLAEASLPPAKASAELLIEVENGRHGSIWKFQDGPTRVCYFNSSGGIWCAP